MLSTSAVSEPPEMRILSAVGVSKQTKPPEMCVMNVMIRTYEHDFGASKSPEMYGLNKFGASVGQSLPKCVSNTVSVCDFFYNAFCTILLSSSLLRSWFECVC